MKPKPKRARTDGPERSPRPRPPALSRAPALLAPAFAASILVAACGDRKPPPPPAPVAPLKPEQQTVIDTLNRLGQENVSGRTHAYTLQPPCTRVVHERFEARPKPPLSVALKGIELSVVEYVAGAGFGLKARVPGTPGSLDLFESRSEDTAKAAGELVRRLAATCS